MHKNKTAGKAARPCKSSAAQLQTPSPANAGKEKRLTLNQISQRSDIGHKARNHTLAAALEHYQIDDLNWLRNMVFGNWLQQHSVTENFPLLELIFR